MEFKDVNSYLTETGNQMLGRVEYIQGTGIVIETYSAEGIFQGKRILQAQLPLFGGFFSGENYNFLAFGQKNEQESDSCEVMRVVKYSKAWEQLGVYSVYGREYLYSI